MSEPQRLVLVESEPRSDKKN